MDIFGKNWLALTSKHLKCNLYFIKFSIELSNIDNNELLIAKYVKSKIGLRVICLPPLIPYTYINLTENTFKSQLAKEKYLDAVACELTQKCKTFNEIRLSLSPEWNDIRPFIRRGWRVNVRYTYFLKLSPIENLRANYSKSNRKDLKKIINSVLHNQWDSDQFVDLYFKLMMSKNLHPAFSRDALKAFIDSISSLDCAYCFSIRNEAKVVAFRILLIDRLSKKAYDWLAADDRGNVNISYGVGLLDAALDYAYQQGIETFDCLGGDIQSISNFKASFGMYAVPYFELIKRNGIIGKLKQLRECFE
jgi:hypothetical protein